VLFSGKPAGSERYTYKATQVVSCQERKPEMNANELSMRYR